MTGECVGEMLSEGIVAVVKEVPEAGLPWLSPVIRDACGIQPSKPGFPEGVSNGREAALPASEICGRCLDCLASERKRRFVSGESVETTGSCCVGIVPEGERRFVSRAEDGEMSRCAVPCKTSTKAIAETDVAEMSVAFIYVK